MGFGCWWWGRNGSAPPPTTSYLIGERCSFVVADFHVL